MGLEEAVQFPCIYSKRGEVQNNRKVFLDDVDLLYIFDENEDPEHNVFRNTANSPMTGEEDKNSALEVWTVYTIDAPIEKE